MRQKGFRRSAHEIERIRLLADEWMLRAGWVRVESNRYVNPNDSAVESLRYTQCLEREEE